MPINFFIVFIRSSLFAPIFRSAMTFFSCTLASATHFQPNKSIRFEYEYELDRIESKNGTNKMNKWNCAVCVFGANGARANKCFQFHFRILLWKSLRIFVRACKFDDMVNCYKQSVNRLTKRNGE